MKKTVLLLCVILLSSHITFSQGLLINSMPFHYHPSFAGSLGKPRIAAATSFRVDNRFTMKGDVNFIVNQNFISFDHFISKLSTGIGIQLDYYTMKNLTFYIEPGASGTYLTGKFVIAPKISWAGRYTLSPSLRLSHYRQTFNQAFYQSGDTFYISHQFIPHGTDLVAGLLFNSPKFFLGITMSVLKRKVLGVNHDSELSTSLIIGHQFTLIPKKNFTLTPAFYFGGYQFPSLKTSAHLLFEDYEINPRSPYHDGKMNLSITATFKKFLFGVTFLSTGMVGYDTGNIRIMLAGKMVDSYHGRNVQLSGRYVFKKAGVRS